MFKSSSSSAFPNKTYFIFSLSEAFVKIKSFENTLYKLGLIKAKILKKYIKKKF
jgi:hypothetical protein